MISKRVVFYADKISPRREPKPCQRLGWHVGPFDRADEFDEAGGEWFGQGVCRCCQSTVMRTDVHPVRVA